MLALGLLKLQVFFLLPLVLLVLARRPSRRWAATATAPMPAGSPEAVTTSVPHPSGKASEQN